MIFLEGRISHIYSLCSLRRSFLFTHIHHYIMMGTERIICSGSLAQLLHTSFLFHCLIYVCTCISKGSWLFPWAPSFSQVLILPLSWGGDDLNCGNTTKSCEFFPLSCGQLLDVWVSVVIKGIDVHGIKILCIANDRAQIHLHQKRIYWLT